MPHYWNPPQKLIKSKLLGSSVYYDNNNTEQLSKTYYPVVNRH